MTHEEVQTWLDAYIAAWRSNEAEMIAPLFSSDAVYSYRPWDSEDQTVKGRDAIVSSWLENPDDADNWDAHYEPYVVEANKAVAVGWSRYDPIDDDPQRTYHNAYLLEFAEDGRCSSFHEFYMLEGR